MRILPFIISFIILTPFGPNETCAHGVSTQNSLAKATVITILHDDGTPLAFAEFSIHPPHGGPVFSQGKTDSLGRVVFLPNVSGKWDVKVFSQDGHGSVTTVDVVPAQVEHTHSHSKQSVGQIQKLITGISILFGIFGLIVLIQNRKPAKE